MFLRESREKQLSKREIAISGQDSTKGAAAHLVAFNLVFGLFDLIINPSFFVQCDPSLTSSPWHLLPRVEQNTALTGTPSSFARAWHPLDSSHSVSPTSSLFPSSHLHNSDLNFF